MDADKLAIDLLLKGMTQDQQTAALESIKESVAQAKAIQKQRIGENVQVVVQALKKLEADIRDRYDEVGNKIEKRVATIKDGKDGSNGVNGKDGKDGRPGRDGGQGPRGNDGLNGNDGRDGEDGVSVTDAHIDFDGSLVISLSSGRTINVGEVVAPDLAEKIKVITNGGGTSQGVLDTLASLQTQIDNIPGGGDVVGPASATDSSLVAFNGTTGKLIKQAATVTVAQGGTGTASPALVAGTNVTITGAWPNQTINASGGGTVTSVDVSGGTTGLTTSGGPVTTSGTITLAGTLAIANGGTGQTTAAAAITALTGTQTSGQYLRSNGTNAVLAAIQAADVPTLNQNTTGTAANVTGTVAVANGGTGVTTSTGTGNVVLSTSPTLVTPALGTPSSGVVTNLTGTASININGTVGATTASTGAFTSLSATGVTTFSAGTVSAPAITTSGDTNTGIFFPAADTIAFAEGGVEAMRIDSSANVGIGTNSPTAKLDVLTSINLSGQNYLNAAYDIGGGVGWVSGYNVTYSSSDIRNVVTGALTGLVYGSAGFQFYTNASAAGGTAASERMRINSSGNVGIGTSSPQAKLAVSNAGAAGLEFFTNYPGGGVGTYIQSFNRSAVAYSNTAYDAAQHAFFTSGTERMRLDSSGNLLVGTTSNANNARINVQGASGARPMDARSPATTGSSITMIAFYDGSNDFCGQITIDAGANTTQYNTSSDYRLKNTIAPMTGALEKVALLKPVTYKWNSNGSDGQGFIAHELAKVCPDAVVGAKDAIDADGKPVYQGIDTSFLVATLAAAIQELKAEFDAYKATHP